MFYKAGIQHIGVIVMLFLFWGEGKSFAQCGVPIAAFPYAQDFEASNGGWFSGGINNDWAWGALSKPVITAAASGSKCWIVGGLTGSGYNNSEASFLQTPCFDLSGLSYPQISVKVFWEMERKFDGANFQYSTDLGATWQNVGSLADAPDCLNTNWFNYGPINYLGLATTKEGWSGNVQSTNGGCQGGNGSGGWVLAQHSMPSLAGQANVIFRFTFGAGTICNNYDGFAVDDFTISEAPANSASFSYTCINEDTVKFTNTSALCPTNFTWNFDDPASGVNNTSSLPNPTHVFSGGGTYTVSLTVGSPNNAPSSTTQTFTILDLTTSIITPLNCFGDNNGSIGVSVSPITGSPLSYNWNTLPPQTMPTVTNLAAAAYTVTVNAANTCQATATVTLVEPAALSTTVNTTPPTCSVTIGSITINETGGTPPYMYSWNTVPIQTLATATGLTPGSYTVTITDDNGCNADTTLLITAANCTDLYFPNTFTPNGNGINDFFGPLGTIGALINYRLSIYDRWGNVVFNSTNPFAKWDGLLGGKKLNSGSFIWFATYTIVGQNPRSQKGMITMLR